MKYDWLIKFDRNTLEVDHTYKIGVKEAEELGRAIKEGDASAQFYMGSIFEVTGEYDKAAYFYNLAAQQYYAPAEHRLGRLYYDGDGVEEDEDICRYLMAEAVNDGDAIAALELGENYDDSMDARPFFNQDDRLSTFWYYIGAKMGNRVCMNNLAYNYAAGIGIDSSILWTTYWYNKSASDGYNPAIKWTQNNPDYKWSLNKISEFEKKTMKHRTIQFGNYYINSNSNKEPIEWIVCEETNNIMTLICKYSIKVMRFSENDINCSWASSKIRNFLNGEFYNEAFNTNEKQKIRLNLSIDNPNPVYETEFDGDTKDLISIPSFYDLLKLNFDEWKSKNAPASSNVRIKGQDYDQWWIRNAGEPGINHMIMEGISCKGYFYACVNDEGKMVFKGSPGASCAYGVRPLIVLKK